MSTKSARYPRAPLCLSGLLQSSPVVQRPRPRDPHLKVLSSPGLLRHLPSRSRDQRAQLGTSWEFLLLTSTPDELSIACPESQVPPETHHENGWACLKLEGPFPFSETGILSSFVLPLSKRAILIFAISTFDTDYVLVKNAWLGKALEALRIAGREQISLPAKGASPETSP